MLQQGDGTGHERPELDMSISVGPGEHSMVTHSSLMSPDILDTNRRLAHVFKIERKAESMSTPILLDASSVDVKQFGIAWACLATPCYR